MLTSLFPNTHTRYTSLPVLGKVLENLCAWLESRGYPTRAIYGRMLAAPLLDARLRRRQVRSLSGCTVTDLHACFPRRLRHKAWTPRMAHALGQSLLKYLEDHGDLASRPPTASERLIQRYREYLGQVRGLAPETIGKHVRVAGDFLSFLRYDDERHRLPQVQISNLEAFVIEAASRVGSVTILKVIQMLRSFLRFLAVSREIPGGLDRHVMTPRHYRGQRIVRALPWNDVLSLLQAVDRSTKKGCRDFAMLLLIATYGLRVSEVASLRLGDIDWRARIIRVPRSKVGAPLILPLSDEFATALVAYLRRRSGNTYERRIFLSMRAPYAPLKRAALSKVFDLWMARAGLRSPELGGAHCLRHALAMHLLRRSTPVKTIGDLLGHRSVESTGVYLRLQIEDLRDVALPLPAGISRAEVRA